LKRGVIALFVASVIVAGSVDARAQSAAAPGTQTQLAPRTSIALKNEPPISPGGAAGIRAAQGASDRGVLIASGLSWLPSSRLCC